jgi:hypothetical protein
MSIAADPIGFHLGTLAEVIDRAAHVEDVLPRHRLSRDDIAKEFETFVVPPGELFFGVLAFFETERVGAEDDVTELRQFGAGVMHRVPRQAGRLGLAEVVLAVVLVPDRDRGCG